MENSRIEQAVQLFKSGAICSQAVFVTYADLFGIDREQAMKLSSPFGGGVGGQRQVCGAISGMSMIAGLYNGMTIPGDKEGKKRNYDTVKLLCEEFRTENGSIRCSQLLGLEPGLPEGMKKKPCVEYIKYCAALIEKHLLPEATP